MSGVFVHQTMKDMLKTYTQWGVMSLAERIKHLDRIYIPVLRISRLNTPVLVQHCSLLLAQNDPAMMECILTNTLVEKWRAGQIVLKDWNRIPRASRGAKEPGIYVNYYTAPDGTGLTIAEYTEYIAAVRAFWYRRNIVTINGKKMDIVRQVNAYYKNRTNEAIPFSDQFDKARGNLVGLVQNLEAALQQARNAQATEVRFPGEVGWALDCDERVKAHHKLQGSAIAYRLTMCIVSVIWPGKNFAISSYCMFRVLLWNHAEVGESLGSHLANSYPGYGGFNYTTAGIQVASAIKANNYLWTNVANEYSAVVTFAGKRIEADILKLQRNQNLIKDRIDFSKKTELLQEKTRQLEGVLKQVADVDDSHYTAMQTLERRSKRLDKIVEAKEAETKKCCDALHALGLDFQLLEEVVPDESQYQSVMQTSSGHGSSRTGDVMDVDG